MTLEDIVDKNKKDFWMFTKLVVDDLIRDEPVSLAYLDRRIEEGAYRDVEDFKGQYEIFVDRLQDNKYRTIARKYVPIIMNEY